MPRLPHAVLRLVLYGALFALMGASSVYAGARQLVTASVPDERGRHATATVLDTRERMANTGKVISRRTELQVEFTAADGARHVVWAEGDAKVGEVRVGDAVDVRYDPENPESVAVGTPPDGRAPFGVALIAVGVVLLLVPLAVALHRRRRPNRHRPPRGAHAAG